MRRGDSFGFSLKKRGSGDEGNVRDRSGDSRGDGQDPLGRGVTAELEDGAPDDSMNRSVKKKRRVKKKKRKTVLIGDDQESDGGPFGDNDDTSGDKSNGNRNGDGGDGNGNGRGDFDRDPNGLGAFAPTDGADEGADNSQQKLLAQEDQQPISGFGEQNNGEGDGDGQLGRSFGDAVKGNFNSDATGLRSSFGAIDKSLSRDKSQKSSKSSKNKSGGDQYGTQPEGQGVSKNLIGSAKVSPYEDKAYEDSFMTEGRNVSNIDSSKVQSLKNKSDLLNGSRKSGRTSNNKSSTVLSDSFVDSDDVSEETVKFDDGDLESVYSSGDDGVSDMNDQNTVIRVYDARFKIPAQSNLGQLMTAKGRDLTKSQSNKQYREMVKSVERYKKFVSTTAILLMGSAMLLTIGIYIYNMIGLDDGYFYIARTRVEVSEIIDFEEITTNKVYYFLYRNETIGASDVDTQNNYFIVPDAKKTCEGAVQIYDRIDRLIDIRNNISSPYMMTSEIYIIILMVMAFLAAAIYVPFRMKEHSIPILLRNASSNVFYDFMKIRIYVFIYFMTLAGCLPHLMFYFHHDVCLHTYSSQFFGIDWTDYYQFCLTMLVWVISIPLAIFLVANAFRDNIKYSMYPFLIANMVFQFMLTILAFVCVVFAIFHGNSIAIKVTHAYNIFVVSICSMANWIYRIRYAKKDLLRTDEEEIDV